MRFGANGGEVSVLEGTFSKSSKLSSSSKSKLNMVVLFPTGIPEGVLVRESTG